MFTRILIGIAEAFGGGGSDRLLFDPDLGTDGRTEGCVTIDANSPFAFGYGGQVSASEQPAQPISPTAGPGWMDAAGISFAIPVIRAEAGSWIQPPVSYENQNRLVRGGCDRRLFFSHRAPVRGPGEITASDARNLRPAESRMHRKHRE